MSIIDKDGVLSNSGNTQVLPASSGKIGRASIAGLGFGNVDKNFFHNYNFLAGVFGSASNSSSNPAATFGGVFYALKSFGLYLNVNRISGTHYISEFEDYISCYNSSSANIYLPTAGREDGRIVYVKRLNGNITVHGNGASIAINSIISSVIISSGDAWMFVYDGQYWCGQKLVR